MVPEVAGSTPVFHPNSLQSLDNHAVKNPPFGPAPSFSHSCAKFELVPLLINEDMYPFKKARLNDCNGELSKRWYIEFYAYDVQQKNLSESGFMRSMTTQQKRSVEHMPGV